MYSVISPLFTLLCFVYLGATQEWSDLFSPARLTSTTVETSSVNPEVSS